MNNLKNQDLVKGIYVIHLLLIGRRGVDEKQKYI